MLALAHGVWFGSSLFGELVRERGHELVDWESSLGTPPAGDYDALLVLGGKTHPDEENENPWLADELELLRRLLDEQVPMLGVCLGAQLIVKAGGGRVLPAEQPERGWTPVELSPPAADDPVFRRLPRRFDAFESHVYTWELPPDGVELARSERCTQAYRLRDGSWGVQFHPEVSEEQLDRWLAWRREEVDDPDAFPAQTRERIAGWKALGRTLCGAFLEHAEAIRERQSSGGRQAVQPSG